MKLKIGDIAHDFVLNNQLGEDVSLGNFKGQWIVLYFYPKDNTPGCTLEAKDFSCLVDNFADLNTKIIGISKDSVKSHRNFTGKYDLKIELLSDQDKEIMKKFGVWRMKKMYGKERMGIVRSTFLIDPQGKINQIWDNVRAKSHAEKVLQYLKTVTE